MKVSVEWADGSGTTVYPNTVRVELVEDSRPMGTAIGAQAGVLYLNPRAFRSMRTEDDSESGTP